MTKIKTIKIQNFKSITDLEANFNGCTAIVTGGNNKGKTSFLKGIVDRIRFVRPDVMVKSGEKEGRGELVLDSGEKFLWEFDTTGKDKLTYITEEGRKSVTKDLGSQFFPPVFDIDKFLQSSPKEQVKQLQKIVGIDFTDIDDRYQKAYDVRTERNREAELYHAKLEKMIKVERVEPVDVSQLLAKKEQIKSKLNALYLENKEANNKTRKAWEDAKALVDKEVTEFNEENSKRSVEFKNAQEALDVFVSLGYKGEEALLFVESLEMKVQAYKIAKDLYPKEPSYIEEMPDRSELDKIDNELLKASETNANAQKFKEYVDHKNQTESAYNVAKEADELVKSIEAERKKMIEGANFPQGILIESSGITVDGLPLDKNQISTSKLYCAALRIASMNLGEVKTLYFDASFLDKNTLAEIQAWANEYDLQLLIERPDFEGGEIKYELIEN